MKRRKLDSGVERRLASGLICSDEFLATASSHVTLEDIAQPHFRRIVNWCFRFYERHRKAPGRNIESMFHRWEESGRADKNDVEAIRDLLSSLLIETGEQDGTNVSFLLDLLETYVTEQRLKRLVSKVEDGIYSGDVSSALSEVNTFRGARVGLREGIDPFKDGSAWKRAFSAHKTSLLTFTGAANAFFGHAFSREGLIGLQAPEKRGKTWWCIEFIVRALKERRRVAFFQVGDLSENQVMMRLAVRILGRPLWRFQCGTVRVPFKIRVGDKDSGKIRVWSRKKQSSTIVTYSAALDGMRAYSRGCGMSLESPHLLVSCYPTGTMSVKDIDSVLQGWSVERGFDPDVVVIDYADILAPERAGLIGRDSVNETWAALRRLSQERRILVISPTQADAASYDRWIQNMGNFSEDKRKLSHVTGMLGLNQTEMEKTMGVSRLNWIVLRESAHNPRRCLYVGQCPSLGRMMTCSALQKQGEFLRSDKS